MSVNLRLPYGQRSMFTQLKAWIEKTQPPPNKRTFPRKLPLKWSEPSPLLGLLPADSYCGSWTQSVLCGHPYSASLWMHPTSSRFCFSGELIQEPTKAYYSGNFVHILTRGFLLTRPHELEVLCLQGPRSQLQGSPELLHHWVGYTMPCKRPDSGTLGTSCRPFLPSPSVPDFCCLLISLSDSVSLYHKNIDISA